MSCLLEVENLKMHFPIHGGVFRHRVGSVYAVDDLSLRIGPGETLGLVGESGCGKTTVGRCIVRLYKPTDGRIRFDGNDVLKAPRGLLQRIRRNSVISTG